MPLNVRRYCASVLLLISGLVIFAGAQTPPQNVAQATPVVPTSGDIMRERISKAKAFIVVRNYNAAIYELENIRRETADPAVQAVVNVLLMNSYLEQGDFKRAQDFLNEAYAAQKTTKSNAAQFYNAVASQVVKGARSRAERYQALGLRVSDRTLPLEATNDLEKMRETLEIVITQSKEIAKDTKKTADAMMLVEAASTSRSLLGRDDYDARRWKDGVADAREEIASSRSVVTSVVNDVPPDTNGIATSNTVTANTTSTVISAQPPQNKPVTDPGTPATRLREVRPAGDNIAKNDKPVYVPSAPTAVKDTPKITSVVPINSEGANKSGPVDVGSLIAYATSQATPIYPPAARNTRTTGVVKVELTVDEKGDVSEVQKASGPSMLQGAARDAVRKWKFRPFVRDGQPVKATGFVSFNFNL